MARSSGRGAQVHVNANPLGRSAALRTPIAAFGSVHRPLCDKIVSRLADRLRQEAERKDGMSARSSKSSARDSGSRRGSNTAQARANAYNIQQVARGSPPAEQARAAAAAPPAVQWRSLSPPPSRRGCGSPWVAELAGVLQAQGMGQRPSIRQDGAL